MFESRRVQTDTAGGQVGSFGGLGAFNIDAPFITGVWPCWRTEMSGSGTVESTTGGFKFPDGTLQNAADDVYTNSNLSNVAIVGNSILHLNVPTGTYLVETWVTLLNRTMIPLATTREAFCINASPSSADMVDHDITGLGHAAIALHSILTTTSASGLDLLCGVRGFTNNGEVLARRARFKR